MPSWPSSYGDGMTNAEIDAGVAALHAVLTEHGFDAVVPTHVVVDAATRVLKAAEGARARMEHKR